MAICRQDFLRADAKCDLANQSVSRDKFVFSLGIPFELQHHYDCNSRHLINALSESINIVRLSVFM